MFRPKSAPALRKQKQTRQKQFNFLQCASTKRLTNPKFSPESSEELSGPKRAMNLSKLSPLIQGVRGKTNFIVNKNGTKKRKNLTVVNTKQHSSHKDFHVRKGPPMRPRSKQKVQTPGLSTYKVPMATRNYRSASIDLEIEFREKIRKVKQHTENARFGPGPMELGIDSEIFRVHQEYFERVCESDQTYGCLLQIIKAEYDRQLKHLGWHAGDASVAELLQSELKKVSQLYEDEIKTNRVLKERLEYLQKELNSQKEHMFQSPSTTPEIKTPSPGPKAGKWTESSTGNNRIRSTTYVSPTEVKELREEVNLLRQVLAEQNPSLLSDRSGSATSTPGSGRHQFFVKTPIEHKSELNSGSNLSHTSGEITGHQKLVRRNSWDHLGDAPGDGTRPFKGTPLGNIPEENIVSPSRGVDLVLGSGLNNPLFKIPEEDSGQLDTSRSQLYTDRSVHSVMSDASSMALSPRLFLGKTVRPTDLPSLEFDKLELVPPSDASDFEDDTPTFE
jgi:hypothetical protein